MNVTTPTLAGTPYDRTTPTTPAKMPSPSRCSDSVAFPLAKIGT